MEGWTVLGVDAEAATGEGMATRGITELVNVAHALLSDAAWMSSHNFPPTKAGDEYMFRVGTQSTMRCVPPLPRWPNALCVGEDGRSSTGAQNIMNIQASTTENVIAPPVWCARGAEGRKINRRGSRVLHVRTLHWLSEIYTKRGVFPLKHEREIAQSLGLAEFAQYNPASACCLSGCTTQYGSYVLNLYHTHIGKEIERQMPGVRFVGVGETLLLHAPAGNPQMSPHIDGFDPCSVSGMHCAETSTFLRDEVEDVLRRSNIKPADWAKFMQKSVDPGNFWSGKGHGLMETHKVEARNSKVQGKAEARAVQMGTRVLELSDKETKVMERATLLEKGGALSVLAEALVQQRITGGEGNWKAVEWLLPLGTALDNEVLGIYEQAFVPGAEVERAVDSVTERLKTTVGKCSH